MNDLPVPINRDLLCVTPQHEDEGYLSPSEEELKRSYASRLGGGGFLNCKPPNTLNIDFGLGITNADKSEDEQIPWEELSKTCLPRTKEEHLSWDRIQLPVPYRFYDEHRSCLRQVRKSPATLYVTDDTKSQASITDKIWRSYGPLPHVKASLTNSKDHVLLHEALKKIQSVKEQPIYIPPKQFLQHIFHLLCGRESLSFSRLPDERYKFVRNSKVLVTGMSPGLISSLSQQFLTAGKIYKRLTHVSALHYDEKLMDREGFGSNAVITAFLRFTSDYLKLYQTSLMLKAPSVTTFSVLNIFFKPFRQQLETLEKVLDLYLATDQITLLKGLNTMMLCSETPYVADLLRSAFITCAGAYLRYVADWIFRGALTPGFHIQRSKAFNYQDRRYWVKQFSQITAVPKFLETAVNIIFETGKAINLLNLIRNTQPRTSLLSCILLDEGTVIRPAVEFQEVTLLEREWQIKLESFFEEYSFLEEDITAALVCASGEEKQNSIDFEAIEEAKKSFELKTSQSRRNVLDKKLEKQRHWYNVLSQQMAEKKDREKQEIENDLLEDEKISTFIKQRDERELNEEIRVKTKHFGEKGFDTVGMRNIKERIAATKNEERILTTPSVDLEEDIVCDKDMEDEKISAFIKQRDERELNEEIRLKTKHFGEKCFDTVGMRNIKERIAATKNEERRSTTPTLDLEEDLVSDKDMENENVSCVAENVFEDEASEINSAEMLDEVEEHKLADSDEHSLEDANLESVNQSSFISEADNVNAISTLNRNRTPTEFDNKFNPNKLKVRSATPYNVNFDLDSSDFAVLPQPLLKLNKNVSLSRRRNDKEHSSLRHDSFFLNHFFQQSAIIPVKAQNRMVNAALLHYFIVEKKLFHHIEALNNYLCLQNGLFGHFLTTLLIEEINNGTLANKDDISGKAGRLNEILGEAVALSAEGSDRSEIRDNLGFILARENNRNSVDLDHKPVKSRMLSSNYELLDLITLNYSVEWPLSILLTDDLLINYEKLFTFLMKLYRAELLLLEMFSVLKFKGNRSKQLATLHHYRYRMLHFVRSVRHYINVTVVHCAWTDLEASFHKMNSLDKLYEGLVRHIKFVTTNCLLGTKGEAVKKLLVDQLIVIECFCAEVEACSKGVNWDSGEEIHPRRFKNLDQKFKVWEEIQKVFLQVFFKLAERGIYQKVSYFLQLFNFNEYFGKNAQLD